MPSFRLGNQTVSVNADDLAQENTLKAMAQDIQNLATALGAVKAEDAKGNTILRSISRQQKVDNNDDEKNSRSLTQAMRDLNRGIVSQAGRVGSAASQSTFNDAMGSFMSSIGAGLVATSFGMVSQVAFDLGEAFRLSKRLGLDFAEEFEEVNKRLAGVGMDYGEFNKVIGTNIAAIRGLGDSVKDGGSEFLSMVEDFRGMASSLGNFSYASVEMAELLGEELELRRSMMDSEAYRNMTTDDFTNSMIENLKQQQAMAKVTGQDVRERIAAQMEAKKSVVAQSFLREQSDETRKRFEEVASAMSKVPGSGQLFEAIVNGIATDLPANAFAPELIAMLGSGAEDLISFITDGMATGNMDIAELERRAEALADGSAIPANTLRTMAATGNKVAEDILTVQTKMVRVQDELAEAYAKSFEDLTNGSEDAINAFANITTSLEEQDARIKQLQTTTALNIIGDSAAETGERFRNFIESINSALTTDFADDLAAGIGKGLGKLGPEIFMRVGEGQELGASEEMFIAGLFANMMGFPTLGAFLRTPQLAKGAAAGGSEILPDVVPTNQAEIDAAMEQGLTPPAPEYASEKDRVMANLKQGLMTFADMRIDVLQFDQLVRLLRGIALNTE